MKPFDHSGKTYGEIKIIKRINEKTSRKNPIKYLCVCKCGTEMIRTVYPIVSGHTQSCGCIKSKRLKESSTKHGMSQTRIYGIWKQMKVRCDNNYRGYENITYSKGWKEFKSFYEDMHKHYSDDLTLDRIDSKGNYCKENCKWSTKTEQVKNRCNTVFLSLKGKTKSLSEWSKEIGIKQNTIYLRIFRQKWSHEKALTTPLKKNKWL